MLFRLAHRHAASSTSCRELASPGMHVVSVPRPDGTRETRIHFDLHGPRNPIGHFGEVVRNRLTFGRTSEYEVYRGLMKRQGAANIPPPAYDLGAHFRAYYRGTFGVSALAGAAFSGSARAMLSQRPEWGEGSERFSNRVEAALIRNTLQRSIEFGVGAALQQDETFKTSGEEAMGRRLRLALYHSVFVKGRGGDELAFPRIAAALGTTWVTQRWHPWTTDTQNVWVGTAIVLSSYVLKSYWHEFRPDIKRELARFRRR